MTFKEYFVESTITDQESYAELVDQFVGSAYEVMFQTELQNNNIKFAKEYEPFVGRKIRIDFAFPDKKLAIEINGPHHYTELKSNFKNIPNVILDSDNNSDASILVDRYKNRHELLVKNGWRVLEIPISVLKNKKIIKSTFEKIKKIIENTSEIESFDYESHKPHSRYILSPNGKKLLERLFETNNATQIAKKIIKQLNLNITFKPLAARIIKFSMANNIKVNIKRPFTEEEIEKIKEFIKTNKNIQTAVEMAKRISNTDFNETRISISYKTLENFIKAGKIPEWRSNIKRPFTEEEIEKIKEFIKTNKSIQTAVEMAKRISNTDFNGTRISIDHSTLENFIKAGKIPEWRSNIKIPFTEEEIEKIKEFIKTNKSIQSAREMVKRISNTDFNGTRINISSKTLENFIKAGKIPEWRSNKKRSIRITEEEIEKIKEFIKNNKNIQSAKEMAKRISNTDFNGTRITIANNTLERLIKSGKIPEWRSNRMSN